MTETAILRTGQVVPMRTVQETVQSLQHLAARDMIAFQELVGHARYPQFAMDAASIGAAYHWGLIRAAGLPDDIRQVILAATDGDLPLIRFVPCLDYDAMGLNRSER